MKISSYSVLSNPQLGDKLIGTDVNNMDVTKNFTISSLFQLGASSGLFVPYTGAINDVDLGLNSIRAVSLIKDGGTASQFLKADGTVDNNTYLTSSSLSGYVPYTGATTNVNLGANNITANSFIKVGGTSSQFLKADGTVDNSVYLTANNIVFNQVLNGSSTVAQAPSATDTPLTVVFGAAQGSPATDVQLDAGGKVIFNRAGAYFVNGYGSVERQGGSGGLAIVLFRAVLNGTQISTTKAFHLDHVDLTIPYEVSIPFQANAGDVLEFQIMRDSSGVNAGGLYPHTNLGGWPNVPSSQIQIWKVN
jgi:hypothetical protein